MTALLLSALLSTAPAPRLTEAIDHLGAEARRARCYDEAHDALEAAEMDLVRARRGSRERRAALARMLEARRALAGCRRSAR